MDASVRIEHELLAVETEHDVHVMLELTVPTAPVDRERAPVHVAVALDNSGSMSGPPLATVKRAARYLVERLGPQDHVAVVTYDTDVRLVVPLATPDVATMGPRIDAIHPGGMTNLSGGWLKALEEAERHDTGVRRVLLLTDGHANQGVTDPGHLVAMAHATGERGVTTTTIGVGDGFAEELLTGIADAAGGGARYATGVEDLPAIFAEEFEDLVSVAAQNVSVEVRPTTDVDLVGVLNEYPSVAVDGGVQVTVGDTYGGQTIRVVLAMRVPAMATLGATKVADLVLRYVTIGDDIASHTSTLPVVVNAVSADEANAAVGDQEVTDEVVVLLASRAADDARTLAENGHVAAATELLRTAAQRLREVAPRSDVAGELLRQAALFDDTVHVASSDGWSSSLSKDVHYSTSRTKRNDHRRRPRDGR